ncbi:hypothetical protein HJC23_000988 [Cyclotella cryptica]|uniref:Uncharacterized protein n=1 Tax=Cyclotella cryptica TaxID=29204 RepID=A0ABD3QMH6_9STRA|eukprot:CCRYP_004126-RA/>CCRYP_004126-RA protein AED:0.08 eAED:0.08 QI:0/-1/0/1/-1/1/1/0/195
MAQQIEMEQTPAQSMESDTGYSDTAYTKPGSYMVPTLFRKSPKQINLMDLRVSDLSALKEDDPFLYYSIPAARKSAMHGIIVNESVSNVIASPCNSRSTVTRSISFESFDSREHMETDESDEAVHMDTEENFVTFCQVTRKSCISFESPNIMVPDDLYALDNAISVSESPGEENEEDDCILSFLLESCTKLSFDE